MNGNFVLSAFQPTEDVLSAFQPTEDVLSALQPTDDVLSAFQLTEWYLLYLLPQNLKIKELIK